MAMQTKVLLSLTTWVPFHRQSSLAAPICEQDLECSMRLAILLLTGLIGCANSTQPHVFKASRFTDEEIANTDGVESSTVELTDAIESKHYCAGIVLKTKYLHAVGNCLATVDHLGIRSSAECDENTDAESYLIQILDSRQGDRGVRWFGNTSTTWNTRLRTTFLHELGHTYGRAHLSRDGTVMNALTSGQTEHLTVFDLEN
jgi:hypothetical protein